MAAPNDLEQLSDSGLRDLLALMAEAVHSVECPHCHLAVVSTELEGAGSTCPHCGKIVSSAALAASSEKTRPAEPSLDVTRSYIALDEEPVSRLTQLGPYLLEEVLDQGSFGRVYLARQAGQERPVALKTPRLEKIASPAAREVYCERFLAEGQRARELRHPGIVEVYHVGLDDATGAAYIAAEYVEGGTLRELLRREERLSVSAAVRLVAQVADAVHFAHSRHVFHCDLKPSNLLLTRAGKVKVTDFGLAIHEDDQPNEEGQVAGTIQYMSPEQLDGQRHFLDGRTDIWSLGVILYELVSGRRPFEGADRRQIGEAIRERELRPLRQRDSSVPAWLDRIVARCLAKTPGERYETAADLAADLRRPGRRKWLLAAGAGGAAIACGTIVALRDSNPPLELRGELGEWHEMPLTGLKKVMWSNDPRHGRIDIKPADKAIHVTTKYDAMLELGWTRSLNWDYELEMKLEPQRGSGSVGVYFGHRGVTDKISKAVVLSIIRIERADKTEHYLTRSLREFKTMNDGQLSTSSTRRNMATSQVASPEDSPVLLSISFQAGFLVRITVNGASYDEISASSSSIRSLDAEWPPSLGRIGLFAKDGVAMMREMRFRCNSYS